MWSKTKGNFSKRELLTLSNQFGFLPCQAPPPPQREQLIHWNLLLLPAGCFQRGEEQSATCWCWPRPEHHLNTCDQLLKHAHLASERLDMLTSSLKLKDAADIVVIIQAGAHVQFFFQRQRKTGHARQLCCWISGHAHQPCCGRLTVDFVAGRRLDIVIWRTANNRTQHGVHVGICSFLIDFSQSSVDRVLWLGHCQWLNSRLC